MIHQKDGMRVGKTISFYKIIEKLPEYIGTSGEGVMSSLIYIIT